MQKNRRRKSYAWAPLRDVSYLPQAKLNQGPVLLLSLGITDVVLFRNPGLTNTITLVMKQWFHPIAFD